MALETMTLYDTSNYGLIKISGPDTQKYLHGQITCDVNKINSQTAIPGAYCNQKGRIISFFYAFEHSSDIYLSMLRSIISNTMTVLKKYAIFSKVTIVDASDEVSRLGCKGLLPESLPDNIVRIPLGKHVNELVIFGEGPASLTFLNKEERLQANNLWESLRIDARIPNIYPETQEKLLPHPCNLVTIGAIDFKKGCYLGQEIIARTHYRGNVKKHAYPVLFEDKNQPKLLSMIPYQNEISGELIDFAHIDGSRYLGLVIVEDQL